MKGIYLYDKVTKQLIGSDVVADNYVLSDCETDIEPESSLYQPAVFNGIKWVSADVEAYEAGLEEERQKNLAEHPEWYQPSDVQKMLMNQATQMAGMQKVIMSQASRLAIIEKGSAE